MTPDNDNSGLAAAAGEPEIKENENCLAGISCPMCGSLGPFRIATRQMALVYDTGTEEDQKGGNVEWGDDSYCQCHECNLTGIVGEFRDDPYPTLASPTNADRAARAEKTLMYYMKLVRGKNYEAVRDEAVDLITDLLHLADSWDDVSDLTIIDIAQMHHEAEVDEESE